ncbi:S9 family peptidase [Gluconobacter sp. LMG 1744]|uniref:alpha/beta hydrolase family protein n=1 Tax=Gluconobacter cadivus TaxID=2728101 RepID=UPI001885032A|nr:S9 family peptidase [Gluconobacter cadivus]MBF0890701.1 S9 family peptidase [Gluconobacter cadivus]
MIPYRRVALLAALFPTMALAAPVQLFDHISISPDGSRLLSLQEPVGEPATSTISQPVLYTLPSGARSNLALCHGCEASAFAWRRDGQALAYVLKDPSVKTLSVWQTDKDGHHATQVLTFKGTLQSLSYGPKGQLGVLAIENAHRQPGAMEAGAAPTGEINAQIDEQRIATIENGHLNWQSPANLYVYEYDWRPDGEGFVATAAPGNGDDHWWIAKLHAIANGTDTVLYTPPQEQQLNLPRVSPDGKQVSFIGGLMSDYGAIGGDAYSLDLTKAGAKPVNLTPGLKATVTDLSWECGPGLIATGLKGDRSVIWSLQGGLRSLWEETMMLSNGRSEPSLSCAGQHTAIIRQSFEKAPEIAAGPIGQWKPVNQDNAALPAHLKARSLTWKSDGYSVQGWLLEPLTRKPGMEKNGKVPMIAYVHGGPSSASNPRYFRDNSKLAMALLNAGYDVFMPNPRGSFGQGEAFTSANRRDFGHGDLRDVLRGIDAVEKIAPVDDHRLGLTGFSYGGYMTMWSVTQTNRFRAAVAGAGISNWLSYYGENNIDSWMVPFFGKSVYDDPDIYAHSSPILYIRQAHTPTFIFVGSADEECPMPQSQEFFHALQTLHVPSSLVIYPGQGHGMSDPKSWDDAVQRTIHWFDTYLTK